MACYHVFDLQEFIMERSVGMAKKRGVGKLAGEEHFFA